MRDPRRINDVLRLIGQAWRANPDLRLGQLIMIVQQRGYILNKSLFYLEDDVLLDAFQKYVGDIEPERNPQARCWQCQTPGDFSGGLCSNCLRKGEQDLRSWLLTHARNDAPITVHDPVGVPTPAVP